jgi:hypothetical protein
MLVRRVALLLVAGSLLVPPAAGAVTPLFDAHLHYNADAARLWPPEQALAAGPWRGVGELHIFAPHRHSPVFRRIAESAARRGLPLQIHGNAERLFPGGP